MATQKKTKNVSYRKNRDYTSSFTWTYELNQDVYHCYTKAKENPAIGYTKRLKMLWDEKHPELNHFNEKQLRLQATRFEKRLVFDVVPEGEESTRADAASQNTIEGSEIGVADEPCDIVPDVDAEIEEEHIDTELLEKLKCKFLQYFDIYKNRDLAERNFKTQVHYQIKDDEWNAMNKVYTRQ